MNDLKFAIPWILFIFSSFTGLYLLFFSFAFKALNKVSKNNSPKWLELSVKMAIVMILYAVMYVIYMLVRTELSADPELNLPK